MTVTDPPSAGGSGPITMRISTLTQLGLALTRFAARRPQAISVDEVRAAIHRGTIFETLLALGDTELSLALGGDEVGLTVLERDRLVEEWEGIDHEYGTLGVDTTDGVTLLLGYILFGIHYQRSDFLIDEDQRRALQRIGWRDGIPEAEQVREALAEWLTRRGENTISLSTLTNLALILNSAAGSGEYDDVTVAMVKRDIDTRGIFDTLHTRLGVDVDPAEQVELLEAWAHYAHAADEERDLALSPPPRSGLTLLVAYLVRSIQKDLGESDGSDGGE